MPSCYRGAKFASWISCHFKILEWASESWRGGSCCCCEVMLVPVHCWGSKDAEFAWCNSAVLGKSLSIILGCIWSSGEPLIYGRSSSLGATGSRCASFSALAAASRAKSSTDVVNSPPGHQVWADSRLVVAVWAISPGQAHLDWKSKVPSCLSALRRLQQSAGTVLQEGDLFTLRVGSTGTTGTGISFWGS